MTYVIRAAAPNPRCDGVSSIRGSGRRVDLEQAAPYLTGPKKRGSGLRFTGTAQEREPGTKRQAWSHP
jgi:hypothetical protein